MDPSWSSPRLSLADSAGRPELELQVPQAPRIPVQETRLRWARLEEPAQEGQKRFCCAWVTVKFRSNRWGRGALTTGFEGAVNYIEARGEPGAAAVSSAPPCIIPCLTCEGARLAGRSGGAYRRQVASPSAGTCPHLGRRVSSSTVGIARAIKHPSSHRDRRGRLAFLVDVGLTYLFSRRGHCREARHSAIRNHTDVGSGLDLGIVLVL